MQQPIAPAAQHSAWLPASARASPAAPWPLPLGALTRPPPGQSAPPLPQTVVVYAATKGYLDKVPVNEISGCEDIILKHIDPRLLKLLKFKGKITPEVNAHLAAQMSTLPVGKK